MTPNFYVPETIPWMPWSYPENLETITLPVPEFLADRHTKHLLYIAVTHNCAHLFDAIYVTLMLRIELCGTSTMSVTIVLYVVAYVCEQQKIMLLVLIMLLKVMLLLDGNLNNIIYIWQQLCYLLINFMVSVAASIL